MKTPLKILLILATSLLLSSCGEWDNLVDSVTGSDDDEAPAVQAEAPRKPVSTPATKTDAKTDTDDTDSKDDNDDDDSEDGYSRKATYTSYGVRNGGRQAWRIPKKGPEFGKKIKVVFSDGFSTVVNNTSKNFRLSTGKGRGFVFKPGLGPNGEGDDNTGTAHGGVYLHAPYGNRSKQVTIYY
jgi:hypothetical protein